MGFLENDGDLILDAVLTDAGRERLARGDGSFQVVKFTFGDDEINYKLYQKAHPNGSAYFDLEIMQTPIMEPITDNGSVLKHSLITIPRNDLLYLPILKLNEYGGTGRRTGDAQGFNGTFVVCVDENTEKKFDNDNGIIYGSSESPSVYIQVDQGLDTTEISATRDLDDSLIETRYIVEIDNRFGDIMSVGGSRATPSYIDDDNIASYNFSLNSNEEVTELSMSNVSNSVIRGPKGTQLSFSIRSSLELNSSTYFFTTLGSTGSITSKDGPLTVNYIDTIVRVKGATTGRTVDVPVRYIKE